MNKRVWAILAGAVTAAIVLVAALWIGVGQISAQGPVTTPVPQGLGSGSCPCGLTPGEGGRWGYQAQGQVDIIAEQLGMTVDEVVAELQGGKTVADLAVEKGVALDTIVEALMAPRREALATAVANGRITQEQADTMLAQMQENIPEHLQQPWQPGRMSGQGRMGGGRMGGSRMGGGRMGGGRGMWGTTQP